MIILSSPQIQLLNHQSVINYPVITNQLPSNLHDRRVPSDSYPLQQIKTRNMIVKWVSLNLTSVLIGCHDKGPRNDGTNKDHTLPPPGEL